MVINTKITTGKGTKENLHTVHGRDSSRLGATTIKQFCKLLMNQQNTYKILKISDEQVLETDQLGNKSKFWVSIEMENEQHEWLFKIPRKNTGKHWAEKVTTEVCSHYNGSVRQLS